MKVEILTQTYFGIWEFIFGYFQMFPGSKGLNWSQDVNGFLHCNICKQKDQTHGSGLWCRGFYCEEVRSGGVSKGAGPEHVAAAQVSRCS